MNLIQVRSMMDSMMYRQDQIEHFEGGYRNNINWLYMNKERTNDLQYHINHIEKDEWIPH